MKPVYGVVGSLLQKVMGITTGFEPAFIREMVVTHGLLEVKKWMGASIAIMTDVQGHFGSTRGQLLLSFAAIWQGCDFCSRGHLYASNLMRFDEDGTLFPLDLTQVRALQSLNDDALWARVQEVLADYPEELVLLKRQNELRLGAPPETEDDTYLMATLAVWEWITDCSIPAGGPEDVPPLDPATSKNKDLQRRYREARGW